MDCSYNEIDGVNYEYLRPPADALKNTYTESYIKINSKKYGLKRTIFDQVTFDKQEIELMQKLKEYAKENNLKTPPWWKDRDWVKRAHVGKLNFKQSTIALKTHLKWLEQFHSVKTLTPDVQYYLKNGFIYICGRDAKFRPIIIVDITKVGHVTEKVAQDFIFAASFCMQTITHYMFIPGKIENWVMLANFGDRGILTLPFKLMKVIADTLGDNFAGSLERFYFINASWGMDLIWNTFKPFIDPFTQEKMGVLRHKDMDKLYQHIPRESMEEKYGGKLKNFTSFWPPPPELFNGKKLKLKEIFQANIYPAVGSLESFEHVKKIEKEFHADKENAIDKELDEISQSDFEEGTHIVNTLIFHSKNKLSLEHIQ